MDRVYGHSAVSSPLPRPRMPVAKGRKSAGTPPSKGEVGDNGREQDSDDESVPDLEDPEIEDVDEDEDDEEEEEEEVEESFPGESEMTALECKNAGNDLYKTGKYVDSIVRYSAAIAKDPATAAFRNNRAAAHMMLQDYGAALTDSLKAAELEPTTVKFWERAAKCYSNLGRTSDARRLYDQILELDPENATAVREVGQVQAVKKLEEQAQAAMESGHLNSALSFCDRALVIAPGNDRVKLLKAEVYLKQKNVGQADRIVTSILRQDSNATDALYVRGLCKFELGDIDKAMDHFKRALRGNPDHKNSRTKLKMVKALVAAKESGKKAWSAGKHDEAITFYTEAIAMAPDNASICSKLYFNRALALSKLKKYQDAISDCTEALDRDPSYVKALIKRSQLKIEVELYDEAVKDCEAALEMNPGDNDLKQALRDAKLELKKSKRKNYYKILKIEKTASDRDIKKGYRKEAMKYHPDRVQGEEEKAKNEIRFKDVGEAYSVLSDAEKRQRYDQGADIEEIQSGGGGGHGHSHGDYNDIFAQMFAGGGGGGGFPGGGGGGFRFG